MNCSGAVAPSLAFTSETLYIVICYSLVFILALIGNTVMFLILFRNQCQKRRRVHSLLLHMTVAHLLVTLIYMPKEIIHNITVGWWGGDLLCRICKFFDVFGVASSAGVLMCLSLDRFYSILFPLYVINAKRYVNRMLKVSWTISILTSLPQIYIFRTAQHPCFDWYTQCVSADVIGKISPRVTFWFSVVNILQVYFIPLAVIVVCYGSILFSISLKTRGTSLRGATVASSNASKSNSAAVNSAQSITEDTCPTVVSSSTIPTITFLKQNNALPPISSRAILTSTPINSNRATTNNLNNNNGHSSMGVRLSNNVPKSNSISVSGIAGALSPPTAPSPDASSLRRTGGEDSFQRAKNRTLKMTIVLVAAFLLCWTPYTVAMFIHFLRHASATQRLIPPLVRKFLYAFAVFNSALSPYLYGYFSFNICEEIQLLFFCCSAHTSCLAKCGCACAQFEKTALAASGTRRHAIRLRQTPELSSSTMVCPTTPSGGSSCTRGAGGSSNATQQTSSSKLPQTPQQRLAQPQRPNNPMGKSLRMSKAHSLDNATAVAIAGTEERQTSPTSRDDLMKFALCNGFKRTVSVQQPLPSSKNATGSHYLSTVIPEPMGRLLTTDLVINSPNFRTTGSKSNNGAVGGNEEEKKELLRDDGLTVDGAIDVISGELTLLRQHNRHHHHSNRRPPAPRFYSRPPDAEELVLINVHADCV